MMKRIILYISFLLLSSLVSFAQNANYWIQVQIDDNGTIKDPVHHYGLTASDYVVTVANLRYNDCVKDPTTHAYMWNIFDGGTLIMFDLDIFAGCGGWKTDDQIQVTFTVNKPGSPLDGCSGSCIFLAGPGGAFIGDAGAFIKTKPVSNPLLEMGLGLSYDIKIE